MAIYRPGSCNISTRGRWNRLAIGVVFFVLTTLVFSYFPTSYRVERFALLFVTLLGGFVGVFESALSFCVVLGVLGRYEIEPKWGVVRNPLYRKLDWTKSQLILLAAVLWALLTAALLQQF